MEKPMGNLEATQALLFVSATQPHLSFASSHMLLGTVSENMEHLKSDLDPS